MRTEQNDPKLKEIANHYGLECQMIKLAEECSEYASAVIKASYYKQCAYTLPFLSEKEVRNLEKKRADCEENRLKELADVLVLAEQIEYLLNRYPFIQERIERYKVEKINRQLERIKEGNQ